MKLSVRGTSLQMPVVKFSLLFACMCGAVDIVGNTTNACCEI